MKVNNELEFMEARGLGETKFSQVERNTYKYTDCGAWITSSHEGIKVGSIVEGSDAEVEADFLAYPFEISEFWDALQWVNDEDCMEWSKQHDEN